MLNIAWWQLKVKHILPVRIPHSAIHAQDDGIDNSNKVKEETTLRTQTLKKVHETHHPHPTDWIMIKLNLQTHQKARKTTLLQQMNRHDTKKPCNPTHHPTKTRPWNTPAPCFSWNAVT